MKHLTKIAISAVFPPIPTRRFDWCAYVEGEEEKGKYGYGETRQAALDELIDIESEEAA